MKTVKQHTVKEVREALVGIRLSERAGWERGWHRHNEKRLKETKTTILMALKHLLARTKLPQWTAYRLEKNSAVHRRRQRAAS